MANYKPGTVVKHFKRQWNNEGLKCLYKIIGIAKDHETREEIVIYEALYDNPEKDIFRNQMYARPLEMFGSSTDKVKYPDAKQELRFEPLDVSCVNCCLFSPHTSSCMKNMDSSLPSELICSYYISNERS